MTRSAPSGGRPDVAALAIAAGLGVMAGIVFWRTGQMPVTAQYARVGPTTAPYVVATGLALLAVATAVSAFRGVAAVREIEVRGPMLWIIAGLLAQMLMIKTVGFSIATGVLFALTARGFGYTTFWKSVPVGIAFSGFIYLIFARGLQLSLPAGPLENMLP